MAHLWRLILITLVALGAIAGCSPVGTPTANQSPSPAGQSSAQSTPSTSRAPVVAVSPIPPNAPGYASASDAGIAGVEAKTGLTYTGGSCVGSEPCLGTPQIFGNTGAGGNDAASVTISNGTTKCFAYVVFDGGFWHYTNPVVCPQQAGYNPVPGSADHVVVPGSCANVRAEPSLNSRVVICLKDGSIVSIDPDAPRYVDKHIWWSVNGHQGWMAHDFLVTSTA